MTTPPGTRYFLEIAFNGAQYHGWQLQKNAISVQEVMNDALSKVLQIPVNCMGCGRTDTRVHARQFYLHFHSENPLPEEFVFRMNRLLPRSILVKKLLIARDRHAENPAKKPLENPRGHARYSAISRTYHYLITLDQDPFLIDLATFSHQKPHVQKMNEAARYIHGSHDFASFSKSGSDFNTGICTVSEAQWKQIGGKLVFTITANRFLRRMVRMLVGTFIMIGSEKWQPKEMKTILEAQNSERSGKAAPPDGLYLSKVVYPSGMLEEIEN